MLGECCYMHVPMKPFLAVQVRKPRICATGVKSFDNSTSEGTFSTVVGTWRGTMQGYPLQKLSFRSRTSRPSIVCNLLTVCNRTRQIPDSHPVPSVGAARQGAVTLGYWLRSVKPSILTLEYHRGASRVLVMTYQNLGIVTQKYR
jgi:hypothetical protein